MCRPATCKTCRKSTWAGCGAHVDQVMAGVPVGQRCTCAPSRSAPRADATRSRWNPFRR